MWLFGSRSCNEISVRSRRSIGLDVQAVTLRDLHEEQNGTGESVRGDVEAEGRGFISQNDDEGCSRHWFTPLCHRLDPDLSGLHSYMPTTFFEVYMSDLLMLGLVAVKEQVKANEEDFLGSVEWLKTKMKITAFSKETLYFLRQLSGYIDLDGRNGTQAGIDQELIIRLVKEQIAEEKKAEVDRQYDHPVVVSGAEDEEKIPLNGEPRQAEAFPVELELFSSQEREGIKAISAYRGVLYGALPAVAAFRELYLPANLLSATEADKFLRSVALRFLSASDFERLGVGVLNHQAEVVSLGMVKLTTEQKEELTGDIIHYPATERPLSAEEGAGRWYKYTAVLALTSGGTTKSEPERHIITKTLVVRENKPAHLFPDPFFKQDHFSVIQDSNFPHSFPASIADDLHQIITSRRASGAIPGNAWMKAVFVLTGSLNYNPVTIRTTKQVTADLNSLEAAALITRRMEIGEGSGGRIVIEADAWVKSDTIRKIYHEQQTLLGQTIGGKTRYKISGADSLHLVSEVIKISLAEKVAPSYHHAYQNLRQIGKITGAADNFRKKYKRACEILSIPFNIDNVVQYIKQHY